jgi:DNA repair exonuclease SbcCD ATPase subunit
MPFEAAEALLWGRETHREHQFLFPRMKELEEQHQAYNSRIQAIEAVAEAAEAATSRIRRLEQQVAAIESDEQDRPFDKWVEGEITGFKGFMEQNKMVRQKQIELETKISDLEDGVDKAKDASRDVEILLNRIGRLENERVHEANRIKRLEKEFLNLTSTRSKQAKETNDLQTVMARPTLPKRVVLPVSIRENPSNQSGELNERATSMAHMASSKYVGRPLPAGEHLEASDAGDETEDEEILPAHRTDQPEGEHIQAPQSPTFNSK